MLFLRPDVGLALLFGIVLPLLPVTFLIAPGLWRNICPLATVNQVPRVLGVSRAVHPPRWVYFHGYAVAMVLFFGIVCARVAGLDHNGPLMGAVLVGIAAAAFTGGVVFKGKSGWCSTICPLLPLERAYGRTPLVSVRNSHCRPCLGCTKNCFDRKPATAYLNDLADARRGWRAPRVLFAAVLPGFITGFFTVAPHTELPLYGRYFGLALCALLSAALYGTISVLGRIGSATLTAVFIALALNLFYWFGGPVFARTLGHFAGMELGWLRWAVSAVVLAATGWWANATRVARPALSTGRRSRRRDAPRRAAMTAD